MNILFVAPTPSHPTGAGNRKRILSMATAFRDRGAELTLLYYAREGIDADMCRELKSFWDKVHIVQTGSMYTAPPADYFRIDDWITRSLSETFLSLVREQHFDGIIINYVMLSSLAELTDARSLTILDTHDVFAGRDAMLKSLGRKPDFFWTSHKEEAKGLSRFDVVLGIQEREAEYFASAAKRVLTVGHLEPKRERVIREAGDNATFGVIGSRNQVNSRFIGDLAQEWGRSAIGQLKIYGAICNDSYVVERAAILPNVELCGVVEDVAIFYESIDVCVNPICVGTGLKIKTVEALAAGVPVLGTEEGFAGLPAPSDFHRLNNIFDLVECCNLYVRDTAFRDQVQRASEAVAKDYRTSVLSQLDELVALIRSHSGDP